jgi:hypothetical protein
MYLYSPRNGEEKLARDSFFCLVSKAGTNTWFFFIKILYFSEAHFKTQLLTKSFILFENFLFFFCKLYRRYAN